MLQLTLNTIKTTILYTKGCLPYNMLRFFSHFLKQQAHKDGNEKGSSKLRKQSAQRGMLQMHWLGCCPAKIWDSCWQLLAMTDVSSILLQDAACLCSKRLTNSRTAIALFVITVDSMSSSILPPKEKKPTT